MVEIFGNKRTKKMLALIDSGADVSMLNLGVAKMLDIDLSKAERGTTIGITGVQETYIATVEIKVEGQVGKRKIPVRFIDSEYVDMLLGQEGFFDAYRIKFEKDHDTFEITPSRKK